MKTNYQMCRGCSGGRYSCGRASSNGTSVSGTMNGAVPYTVQNTPSPPDPALPPSQVSVENYQEMLSNLIGSYIITELLIGIDRLILRQGYLTAVGPSYYILYDPEPNVNTVCDIYSLKFVSFFESRERPTTEEFNRWLESLRQETYVFNSASQYNRCKCTPLPL